MSKRKTRTMRIDPHTVRLVGNELTLTEFRGNRNIVVRVTLGTDTYIPYRLAEECRNRIGVLLTQARDKASRIECDYTNFGGK